MWTLHLGGGTFCDRQYQLMFQMLNIGHRTSVVVPEAERM
jgi:hypothetical protein